VWVNVKNIAPSNPWGLAGTHLGKKDAIFVKFLSQLTVFCALVVIVNYDAFQEVRKEKNCTTYR
jgi:hypothetical protein